jgi:hypothetical protein
VDFRIAPIFGAAYHDPKIGAAAMADEGLEFQPLAKVSWCARDIMDHYTCSEEQAARFLDEIEDDLQLAMIAAGWRVIHKLCEFETNP